MHHLLILLMLVIKCGNTASIKLFESMGFKLVSEVLVDGESVLNYQYKILRG